MFAKSQPSSDDASSDTDYTFPTPPSSVCEKPKPRISSVIRRLDAATQRLEAQAQAQAQSRKLQQDTLSQNSTPTDKASQETQKATLGMIKSKDLPPEFFEELARREDLLEELLRTVARNLLGRLDLDGLRGHLQYHKGFLTESEFAAVAKFL